MAQLILRTAPVGSYYYFFDKVVKYYEHNHQHKYIYILPVNRAVRYSKKNILRSLDKPAIIEPNLFTFNSLLRKLYDKSPESIRHAKVIDESVQVIIIENILEKLNKDLSYFNISRNFNNGLIRKINQMISEFREYGYSEADFEKSVTHYGDKYRDFGVIMNYLAENYADDLIDEPSLHQLVVTQITPEWFSTVFPEVTKIFINGYGIYPPPILKLLTKLKQVCQIEIKLEYDEHNEILFEHSHKAFESLSTIADKIITDDYKSDIPLNIFSIPSGKKEKLKSSERIHIQKCKDVTQEVSYIAATIRDLHLNKNIPLHKIALTFPEMDKYAGFIRRIFEEYGIAYNLSTGFNLNRSPLIRSVLQVLRVVNSGFEFSGLSELLLSPFLKKELKVTINNFRTLCAAFSLNRINYDLLLKYNKYRQILNQQDLEALKTIYDQLESLKKKRTAKNFHNTFLTVLKKLGFLDWHKTDNEYMSDQSKEREFRAFNSFIKIVEELIWLLNLKFGDRLFTAKIIEKYLRMLTDEAVYSLGELPDYGVQIMPRLEIQSVDCRVLFLGGMIEGEFPRKINKDIFFNDDERDKLGLPAIEDLVYQDRFMFFQLLNFPQDAVYLTYPSFENESALLVSGFIENLKHSIQVTEELNYPDDYYLLNFRRYKEMIALNLRSPQGNKLFSDFALIKNHKNNYINMWLDNIKKENERYGSKSVTRYEGNLSTNERILPVLDNMFKSFPVTALETYAFCPMQFFLEKIIKIEKEPEFEDYITPQERGSIVHKILYRFYSELKNKKATDIPWKYRDDLIHIAREEFERLKYEGLFWNLELEKYFGFGDNEGLWEVFLAQEKEEINRTELKPGIFEKSFEYSIRAPQDNHIKINGKIDRIDINKRGQFIIIDYKTGSNFPAARQIFEGLSLQLPLYTKAAHNLFKDKIPAGFAYYQVKDEDNCKRHIVFYDQENFRNLDSNSRRQNKLPDSKYSANGKSLTFIQMIERSCKFVISYANRITKGDFRHTYYPNEPHCKSYCEYAQMCRKNISKMQLLASES